jgi:hypothetical protein
LYVSTKGHFNSSRNVRSIQLATATNYTISSPPP